ncbi:chitooligosaccharide synthase NodC, partial [Bradyrhizobium sp. SSUT112]|nr:chitooligosaccharide synthase NodC [Bradyrhizobium sp. SSUT112]
AALAQLALTDSVPWWTGLTIVAMTMVRCSVAALRAGELRFLGFALHTPINIFLLLPMKAYALCTLSNSDWLSRKVAKSPDVDESKASIEDATTGPSLNPASERPGSIRRAGLSRSSPQLIAPDGIAAETD